MAKVCSSPAQSLPTSSGAVSPTCGQESLQLTTQLMPPDPPRPPKRKAVDPPPASRIKMGRRTTEKSPKGHRPRSRSFLLGGNKRDPLNLSSIAGGPGTTPAGSPQLTPKGVNDPIEVKLPQDTRDPLKLDTEVTPQAQGKRRKRKRRDTLRDSEDPEPSKRDKTEEGLSLSDSELLAKTDPNLLSPLSPCLPVRKAELRQKSPVEPKVAPKPKVLEPKTQKKPKDKARFRYGNYDRYYGKRLSEREADPRVKLMEKSWIEGKDVLDIGCNVGFVTLALAKELGPKMITGIDIDGGLVGVARKNVRHYEDRSDEKLSKFPPSFSAQYGPISAPSAGSSANFPQNVLFRQGNYVLQSEAALQQVRPEYDTILALSVTKWVHLNWGDDGLKRFFKRIFKHLRPGGRLVLEPQPFNTYKKRKAITPEMFANYEQIRFKPTHFTDYLLSSEVGFVQCFVAGTPKVNSQGFRRPVQVFVKPPLPSVEKETKPPQAPVVEQETKT